MSSDLPATAAIRLHQVGKQFMLPADGPRHDTLRDVLAAGARRVVRGPWRPQPGRVFRALDDVTLDVPAGTALGLVGANGAGKSTLLRILARVTPPSAGEVVLRGRVGSLLEVGTGFHPELTGRENIYLNGAILGMRRTDIRAQFDAIVAFAEVGPFLDVPVKRYSSGMHLRLGFAVAAHLRTDILLVDEVLAVGDRQFQQRCLGTMTEATREGRTVVFVSHHLDAVQRLCPQALLLERGRVATVGPTRDVLAHYAEDGGAVPIPGRVVDLSACVRRGSGDVRVVGLQVASDREDLARAPYATGPLEISLHLDARVPRVVGSLAVSVTDPTGLRLLHLDTAASARTVQVPAGISVARLQVPTLPLAPGRYRIGVRLADRVAIRSSRATIDQVDGACDLEVRDGSWNGRHAQSEALASCDFTLDLAR